MSDEPIEMDATGMQHSVTAPDPIGCHDVQTHHGLIHFCEGNGMITSHIMKDDVPVSVALMICEDGEDGAKGRGHMQQLDASTAREIAMSIMRLADELEPERPN